MLSPGVILSTPVQEARHHICTWCTRCATEEVPVRMYLLYGTAEPEVLIWQMADMRLNLVLFMFIVPGMIQIYVHTTAAVRSTYNMNTYEYIPGVIRSMYWLVVSSKNNAVLTLNDTAELLCIRIKYGISISYFIL